MRTARQIISPISIDLGAANTGVYSAFYEAGASPSSIKREGTVYCLGKDDYTLLMVDRTAKRHQRRGLVRRKLAKRLFKLIWEREFKLQWTDGISEAIGFLFNRRGFSFLQEEYDAGRLANFPREAWDELPEDFKNFLKEIPEDVGVNSGTDNSPNIEVALQWFVREEKTGAALEKLCVEQKETKGNLVYYDRSIKLKKHCAAILEGRNEVKAPKGLESISFWIVKRWAGEGIVDMRSRDGSRRSVELKDITASAETVRRIVEKMPDYSAEVKELKNSIWNFNVESLDVDGMDRKEEKASEKNPSSVRVGNAIHNLAYALYSVDRELSSGAKYRKKYLDEILEILGAEEHPDQYLREFVQALQAGEYAGKTPEQLARLVGHISNLELKPLRKYFNDTKHKGGDCWDPKKLEEYFSRWLLKEWRVDAGKNPDKAPGKSQDYRAVCSRWREHKRGGGSVVGFWLSEDPVYTIPPYQNNNNRRPPRCQSLIVNAGFLEREYPRWREWLQLLEGEEPTGYLGGFKTALEQLKTGRAEPVKSQERGDARSDGHKGYYFGVELEGDKQKDSEKLSWEDLDARVLQFILDRTKDSDPFILNELYSYTKKIRQLKQRSEDFGKWKSSLEKALARSKLPKALKTNPDFDSDEVFPGSTFLHLVCRYYKLRQRAKDGRLFIHPEYRKSPKRGYEKTNRFEKNGLLRYCNQKPRQKKYQAFMDVASVFQVSAELLEKRVGSREDERLQGWLGDIKGLQKLCKDCSKAQKDHRGALKTKLELGDDKDLVKLKEKAEEISKKIGEKLFGSIAEGDAAGKKEIESRVAKFESVFSFAQLHNILFTERSGNSNTCPICSLDNGKRMEAVHAKDGEMAAKARRLPAVATRIIDGAVMRMARIVAGRIADDRWPEIEKALKDGARVRIPIITESNQFEFEPSLEKLKPNLPTRKTKKKEAGKEPTFSDKTKRIQEAGKSICPYIGVEVGGDGQLDHIIPRASKWGTLNDEANLIYASEKGNNKKGNSEYYLADLDSAYKKKVFGTDDDDDKIEQFIADKIWDSKESKLSIGKYRSFINLEEEQQRAFRHALFSGNRELRLAVIEEINNRRRTLVNGTQRYFAEVLANEFHKKALAIERQAQLEFDYFSVAAFSNSSGDSVRDFGEMSNIKECRELLDYFNGNTNEFVKAVGEAQKPYSHLMDATVAFLITADMHRNEGSLGINIPEDQKIIDLNRGTGELTEGSLFKDVWVHPDKMNQPVVLKRRAPRDNFREHRSFTRDKLYADRYLPVLMRKVGEKVVVRVGFSWTNSAEWVLSGKNKGYYFRLLKLCRQRKHFPEGFHDNVESVDDVFNTLMGESYFEGKYNQYGHIALSMDRLALHEYWIKEHNTEEGTTHDDFFSFCYSKIGYRTEKEKVELDREVLSGDGKFYTTFNKVKITLPCKREWERCLKAWEGYRIEHRLGGDATEGDRQKFLSNYFAFRGKRQPHQRARKVFSLPVKSSGGKYLLKRKGWGGNATFQLVDDSDSRSTGNKALYPVITEKGIEEMLAPWAKSRTMVKLPPEKLASNGEPVDPDRWFEVDRTVAGKNWPEGCEKVELRLDNTTRPTIRITLSCSGQEFDCGILKNSPWKPRSNKTEKKSSEQVLNEFLAEHVLPRAKGESFVYQGNSLADFHRKVILSALEKE